MLFEHTRQHFRQPLLDKTPFLSPPLSSFFGPRAETRSAKEFTTNPSLPLPASTNTYAKQILQHLRPSSNDGPQVLSSLTAEEIKKSYSLWPEKTLTSSSGLHLGHYKVWIQNHLTDTNLESNDNQTKHPTSGHSQLTPQWFFNMISLQMNLCISLNHPLQRWSRVHMIYAPKDQTNSPKMSRLRMLNQLDSQLNMLRRIFIAHRTMHTAESSDLLADKQWGGRQGR